MSGVTVNAGDKNVVGGIQLRSGATLVKVAAISPDIAQMKSLLGFEDPKEPRAAVEKDNDGNTRVRIDVWVARPQDSFLHKEAFFVTQVPQTASTGSQKWVNDRCQFCYATGEPTYDWYDKTGLRQAWNGEEQFMAFIKAWINHDGGKKGDNLSLNWDAIFAGDFSEIQGILALTNPEGQAPNTLGCLFGVRAVESIDDEGQPVTRNYQGMYKKLFTRSYQNLNAEFHKKLDDEYGEFKNHDHMKSLVWQSWSPDAEVTAPAGAEGAGGEATATEASAWS